MQSPKSPEYNAGYRSTSSVDVTPAAFVPWIVSVDCARTAGSILVSRAKEETRVVAHDGHDSEGFIVMDQTNLVG